MDNKTLIQKIRNIEKKDKSKKSLDYYYKNRERILQKRKDEYEIKGKNQKKKYYLKVKNKEDYLKKKHTWSTKRVMCPHCNKSYANGYLKQHIARKH